MPRIEIVPTKGELPIAGYGLASSNASCAINTKFWHGMLEPHECPTLHCSKDFKIKSMYKFDGCECFASPDYINIAQCYCDYVILSDGIGKPQLSTTHEICLGITCNLGVPCPSMPPFSPASGGGNSCEQNCISFIYRYINKYGQVGAPSPPSQIYSAKGADEGFEIVFADPNDGYCIEQVEIFALVAGNKTGLEQKIENNSAYLSAGKFPIGENALVKISNLGLEIDSVYNYPPPNDLNGITCHEFGLVGFEGKNIWYTESNQIGAWGNNKCIDHEIKCIEYWNKSLYIFTDSWIYRMDMIRKADGYDFDIPFRYGERPFPIIGRQSAGQAGIFFPSVMGGVLVNQDTARIITSAFGKDDWLSLCHDCETSFTAVFDYGVGIFTKNASYIYEFGDGTFGEFNGEVYQLPFIANAVYVDKNGILNYAVEGDWYKWDNCYECKLPCDETNNLRKCCCPYEWTSKGIIFDTMLRLTAGFIEFEPSTGDVRLQIYERDCMDEPILDKTFNEGKDQCRKSRCFRKYFRLKNCRIEDQIFIKISGCAKVRRVVLGTSRSALRDKDKA